MGWADYHIKNLQNGETVQFRPSGNSMTGRVDNKQLCTVEPLAGSPSVGDVVLCKVKGNQYLHLVKAIKTEGEKVQFQIGNNKGGINGWVGISQIFGLLTKVEK